MTWSPDKYFAKAELYWTYATSLQRDEPRFLLYATIVLELVVRGSLCKIHPSLNAANDVESLLYANGQTPRTPPKTVALSEAIARLQRYVIDITKAESEAVEALIQIRNRELHDDADALGEVKGEDVMPHVYSFFTKVTVKLDIDLAIILGDEDAKHARNVAAAAARDRKRRMADLIRVHKDRFYGLDEDEQKRLRAETDQQSPPAIVKGVHMRRHLCPACKGQGVLAATFVGASAPLLEEDGIYRETRLSPTLFDCKSCGLTIKGLDELMAAGFPHELRMVVHLDPIEHLAIDPMDYVDVHKIVQDYMREEEYGDE